MAEIGQSAAELLNAKAQEEGSETMRGTPISSGDDIVQTTIWLKTIICESKCSRKISWGETPVPVQFRSRPHFFCRGTRKKDDFAYSKGVNMAYLHCHKCNWSQDDFYDRGYNPAKYLMDWNDYLFGEKHEDIDKQFSSDAQFLRENGPITTREVLAREYERFARKIRTMRWITYDDYKNEPNKLCPACGSKELDID